MDWEGFRNRSFSIYCESEEEIAEFFEAASEHGYRSFHVSYREASFFCTGFQNIKYAHSAGWLVNNHYVPMEIRWSDFCHGNHEFDQEEFINMITGEE